MVSLCIKLSELLYYHSMSGKIICDKYAQSYYPSLHDVKVSDCNGRIRSKSSVCVFNI